MEKEFIRVRSVRDIIIFVSLIASGSILIALPTGAGINITGFFLIFAGLILALVLRTGYKDTETGENYFMKEIYFQQAMHSEVKHAVESDPASLDMSQEDKGNALKVDIYYSRKNGKAYMQMFEYVPYNYQPCSRMCVYEFGKVKNLIK